MGKIRIGVSGWAYEDWRGDFYPTGLRHKDELSFAADAFDTIEINGTFYSLSSPDDFRRWYQAAPRDFVYSVKGSRFITHNKKLKGVEGALANFLASGVLELGDKLGPVLWQLSSNLHFDADRVDGFLELLPHDSDSAVAVARRHDDRIQEPAYGPEGNRRLRHVLEVRHDSYLCDEMVAIARRHGVALAFSDAAAWPYTEEITAGFCYVRLHGPEEQYASAYGDRLTGWADRIQRWRDGNEPNDAVRITDRVPPRRKQRDVYVYFDNDVHGHAPREAVALAGMV